MSISEAIQRRDFLKGALSVALMAGAEEIVAAEAPPAPTAGGPPVGCGVVGLGVWGRELLSNLGRQPLAKAVALCDTYEPSITRSKENAPGAATYTDYRRLLDDKTVTAVFVATPSHQHKQIVIDALQAGKHVYCEAPLAITVEESRAIARAGKSARTVFAAGLQARANPQHHHVWSFMRSGVLSDLSGAYGQFHKKDSWRRTAPSAERAAELNWRLNRSTSPGLAGEIGIHQIDVATWFLDAVPLSVSGSGGILHWDDGREVADTIQCQLNYKTVRAKGLLSMSYNASLVNSFGGAYNLFTGSDSSLLIHDLKAWMIKETDSPLLGWEVYASKEKLGDDTGIVMVANATKLIAAGQDPAKAAVDLAKQPIYYAIEEFVNVIRSGGKPSAGPVEGHTATVVALKANEAVTTRSQIEFTKEWFDLGA